MMLNGHNANGYAHTRRRAYNTNNIFDRMRIDFLKQTNNMQSTFFWHDYETFGTEPRTDRPTQFAGIRTDMDLNEIDEPVMVYCKPSLDALPSPESCLITGITPQFCQKNGVTEREFSATIEHELGKSNTISVGYNSIRFDDEVTRYLFWRNLIDPYAREWKNECSRWDLIDVTRALHALKPQAIAWPLNYEGVVNFKLEALSKANTLTHESAHDALSDVRATINLARLIKKVEPRFFEYCLALRSKEKVRTELSLNQKRPILHVSSMYGIGRGCLAIIWPLAIHPTNKNEVIVWDLQEDPGLLADLSVDEIKTRIFTRKEDLPTNISRLPIKTISLNKSPFVVNNLQVLTNERASQLNINLEIISQHAEIAQKLQLHETLWNNVYARDIYNPLDVDEDLYGKFVPDVDRQILERLRRLNGDSLSKERVLFQDSRLDELVFRYRARNFPEHLNTDETERWQQTCFKKNSPKLEKYWQDFNELYSKANKSEIHILDELKSWVTLLL